MEKLITPEVRSEILEKLSEILPADYELNEMTYRCNERTQIGNFRIGVAVNGKVMFASKDSINKVCDEIKKQWIEQNDPVSSEHKCFELVEA
ncbi:MAG: hypothetical protein A2X18_07485 [Bacteroidetes bacterium GWF2_40_14]|nr:MAG: hypothetical protein A2X18_07485 [Bacteroidetes bacterium GWF2_40_14]